MELLGKKYGRFALAYDILQMSNWQSGDDGQQKLQEYLTKMQNEAETSDQLQNLTKVYEIIRIIQIFSNRVSKKTTQMNTILFSNKAKILSLMSIKNEQKKILQQQRYFFFNCIFFFCFNFFFV